LPFPLFNWNGGEVAQAAAARDRARANLDLVQRAMGAELARARRSFTLALTRVERSRRLPVTANRVAAMSLQAYAEGAIPLATVAAQTAAATARPFARVVRAIGTVTPRPGHYAELAAPGPTRVARIFVAPDQRVQEGDSLVEFERAPFDAAAQSAAAALEAAQRTYARAVRLVQAGILPQKDSDQAASELAQAQAAAVT